MRIVAGAQRGRRLVAPPGEATRPTSERARQALFDMLWHAPWAGRAAVEGARALDAFAGTGALGLEALSRGAAHATFVENGRDALVALRANIAACRAEGAARVIAGDALAPPRAQLPCSLVFLDPPYGEGLAERAIASLAAAGWVAPGALVAVELGPRDVPPTPGWPTPGWPTPGWPTPGWPTPGWPASGWPAPGWELLTERAHGKARLLVLRAPA